MTQGHHPDWYAESDRARRTEQLLRLVAAALGVDLSDLYPGESDG